MILRDDFRVSGFGFYASEGLKACQKSVTLCTTN